MHTITTLFRALFWLAVAGLAAWLLGLDDTVRASIAAGHLLDWVMGTLCLVWLIVLLKAPWDLFFQAHAVTFELQRSRERGVPVAAGREEYVRTVRRRLFWLAIGAHAGSAALVALVTWFAGSEVGYYFAAFYLVSTAFRPAVAGYVYLTGKLRAIGEEARYPREDVLELRDQVKWQKEEIKSLTTRIEQLLQSGELERACRERDTRELRHNMHEVSRQLETTVSRLTDNQEVIRGIQAFVRLVAQSAGSPG